MSDYLCEELIIEIFSRLPSKSLIRFRSLSKSLCGCISNHGFIRNYTFRFTQKIRFTHRNRDKTTKAKVFYTLHGKDELPLCLCPQRGYVGITNTILLPCDTPFKNIGSCNGIFCMETIKGFSLWNPSIRRKLSVPKCPQRSEPRKERFGFGFDPINDDYKIVWISSVSNTSFVYAVKNGTWCEIASPKRQVCEMTWLDPFSFNGVLYQVDMYPSSAYILTFDFNTHVFGMIPLPGPTWVWLPTRITTIQDSLALITYRNKLDDTWIWVWRDVSWSVAFKLETSKLPIDGALQLQPSNNNGDLLLSMFEDGLQVYNPKTGMLSRVVDFTVASQLITFDQYLETLHFLDIGETTTETT